MTDDYSTKSPTMIALQCGALPLGTFPAVYCRKPIDRKPNGFVVGWCWVKTQSIAPYSKAFLRGHDTGDALDIAAHVANAVYGSAPKEAALDLRDAEWLAQNQYYLEGGSFAIAALLGAIAMGTGHSWPARTLAWGGLGLTRTGIAVVPTALSHEKFRLASALGTERVFCPQVDAAGFSTSSFQLTLIPAESMSAATLIRQLTNEFGADHVC